MDRPNKRKVGISVSTAPDRDDGSVLTIHLIGPIVFTTRSFDTDPALSFDAAHIACVYQFSPKRSSCVMVTNPSIRSVFYLSSVWESVLMYLPARRLSDVDG